MIGLGIPHSVPPGDNSGMWPALLVVAFVIWFALQFRASRTVVWAARANSFEKNPFRIEFMRDVRATVRYASDWPRRFRDRREFRRLEGRYKKY